MPASDGGIVANRYCTNCGQELQDEVRFCPNCGKSVMETAAVPTPEADVSVPPPQQPVSSGPGPAPNFAPAGGSSSSGGGVRRFLIGCVGILVILLLLVIVLAAIGSGGGESGGGTTGESDQAGTEPKKSASKPSETFTRENYRQLASDPDSHDGAAVDITGQIFGAPEEDPDYVYFQMFADPENAEWNTIVQAPKTEADLASDDYVHIKGTVVGSMEGQNAFGGDVSAVQVEANSVEEVEGAEAVDPTQKSVQINATGSDQGFFITIDKIEFAEKSTRVYIIARNDTAQPASFYVFDAKIVQGSTQVDQDTPFDYEIKEPQDTLSPGVETQGIVAFGPVNPSQPFHISFEWSSDNYNITTKPITFQIQP